METETENDAPDVPIARRAAGFRLDRAVALRRYEFPILTLLGLVPFLILLAKLPIDGPYANWGDNAILELQTRDVGRHLVNLGPYSRFGFAHPGPMLFYLLALPYWIFGGEAPGLNFGVLLINGAAFVGIAWIAYRRGGVLLLVSTLLAIEVFLRQWGVGPDFVRNPWNPYVTVLPLLLFIFLAWELACASRVAVPAAIFVGSFLVQSHLGYLPAVALMTVVGVGLGWRGYRRQWRGSDRVRLRKTLIWSGVLLGALWALPLLEQLTHWPGNGGKIAAFQVRNRGDHSMFDGLALIGRYFGNVPGWLLGRPLNGDGTFEGTVFFALPVILIAVAATWIAARRRATTALRYVAVVGAGLVAAVIAVPRITGDVFEYLVRWMQMPTLAVLLIPFVVASDPKVRTPRRALYVSTTIGLAVLFAGFVVSNALRVADTPSPGGPKEPQVAGLMRAVRDEARRTGTNTVLIDEGGEATYAAEFGVGIELQRRGYRVRYPRSYVNEATSRHVVTGDETGLRVAFAAEGDRARLANRPGARFLGEAGGLVVFAETPTGS